MEFSRREPAPPAAAPSPIPPVDPPAPIAPPPPAPSPQPVPAPVPAPMDDELAVSRQAELDTVLRGITSVLGDVSGAVFASRDGLCVASTGVIGPQASKLAAMAAAVLSLSESALDFGEAPAGPPAPIRSTVLRGSDGCLAVVPTGLVGALVVQTTARPNVGLMHVELPQAAARLAELASGAAS